MGVTQDPLGPNVRVAISFDITRVEMVYGRSRPLEDLGVYLYACIDEEIRRFYNLPQQNPNAGAIDAEIVTDDPRQITDGSR
jgi:hypothetical protein